MSNVQNLPETDPTGVEELHDLLQSLASANRPFGVEVHFSGKCFTWQIKIGNLKATEITLEPFEKRTAPVPNIPTAVRTVHRK